MLELRQVTKSFTLPDGSPLNVLDIEHFHAKAGEQVVIVGQSGCGKTTLLHVIAGICRPDAGRVLIDGWDIPVLSEADRDQFRAAKIGYVFQTFNLLPAFSALENVMIGDAPTAGPTRSGEDAAQRVGLSHRRRTAPHLRRRAAARGGCPGDGQPAKSSWPTNRPPTSPAPAAGHRHAPRAARLRTWCCCWSPTRPGGQAVRSGRTAGRNQSCAGEAIMSLWKIALSLQYRRLAPV